MAKPGGGSGDDWTALPLDKGLFANLDPDAITQFQTAIENGFVNEEGGNTRFPGLSVFATLPENGRVYLSDFQGDLIAATSKGNVYRIGSNGAVTPCTGVQVSGGRRVIMAATDQDMRLAAGGPIVRLRKSVTEVLSQNAPSATHIVWLDGYTLANQVNSLICQYDDGTNTWDPLNTIGADSNPKPVTCIMLDPFREIFLAGDDKIEQWERQTTGDAPFFRRWSIGDGSELGYCFLFANNSLWTINSQKELVQFLAQISKNVSNEIGLLLEDIDDWTDAWMGGFPNKPLNIVGQKFILIQMPNATNEYGTKGVTLCYDYRSSKYFQLYGWDNQQGVPTRWPGWSHWPLWNSVFVGGEGVIYALDPANYTNAGTLQRWLVRTAHLSQGDLIQVADLRLRLKRGLGAPSQTVPNIQVRGRRDAGPFGGWVRRDLGAPGDNIQFKHFGSFGTATTFQFEIMCAENVPINLIKAEVRTVPVKQ